MIYLDNNATTRLDPVVTQRMHELMQMRLANPSSQHAEGRKARQIVERAREKILKYCNARTHGMASDQLIFTSGGTESNNLAIFGLTETKPGAIVVSSIEHPSVLAAVQYAEAHGREVRYLPCSSDGVVSLEPLQTWLSDPQATGPVALVSLMLANNETGVLQQVAKAASMCRQAGALIHTDAVQALGKLDLNFAELDVDAMTITAHKLHGPIGIGALVLRHGIAVAPRTYGGFQQLGQRPGTEMPVLAGGFETAVENAVASMNGRAKQMRELRDALQQKILEIAPKAIAIGVNNERLPHTLSIAFPGVDRQALQLALDMAGVACSTGSACASGSSQPSHVLEAMGLAPAIVRGGIRFSLSAENTLEEIKETARILTRIIPKLEAGKT